MDNSSILLTNTIGAVGLGTTRPPTFKNVNDVEIGTLCGAWVQWSTHTSFGITADFNVASITDGGVGITSIFFEKSLPLGMNQGSSRYAFSGTAQTGTNRSSITLKRAGTGDPTNQMTDTMLEVRCGSSGGDTNHDSNYNSVIVFANRNVT